MVRLSSGYPLSRLEQLVRQLEPILEVQTPTTFTLDLRGLGQFDAFGERLRPILGEVGIAFDKDPEIFDVHEVTRR